MSRPKSSDPTLEDLLEDSKVLAYEFDQLCGSGDKLRVGTHLADRVTHNNTVQGFAIACRNLSFFFFAHHPHYSKGRQDGDLDVRHFLPDWPAHCPALAPVLRDAKDDASKQVMHMTGKRRGLNFNPGNVHRWPVDSIERELLVLLRTFLRVVPETLLHPESLRVLRSFAPREPAGPAEMVTTSGHISVLSTAVTHTCSPAAEAGQQLRGFTARTS